MQDAIGICQTPIAFRAGHRLDPAAALDLKPRHQWFDQTAHSRIAAPAPAIPFGSDTLHRGIESGIALSHRCPMIKGARIFAPGGQTPTRATALFEDRDGSPRSGQNVSRRKTGHPGPDDRDCFHGEAL